MLGARDADYDTPVNRHPQYRRRELSNVKVDRCRATDIPYSCKQVLVGLFLRFHAKIKDTEISPGYYLLTRKNIFYI